MRDPDQPGDRAVEEAQVELHGDEREIVWVQGRVESVLDRGQVSGVVLRAGVIAEDGEGGTGKKK